MFDRGLSCGCAPRTIRCMESHEWHENTDEGKRYYRANFHSGRWSILTTTIKRDPVWDFVNEPDLHIWQELRQVVFNKYQRKRCPWDRVAELDRIIEASGSET